MNTTIDNIYRALAEHGANIEEIKKLNPTEKALHDILVGMVMLRAKE